MLVRRVAHVAAVEHGGSRGQLAGCLHVPGHFFGLEQFRVDGGQHGNAVVQVNALQGQMLPVRSKRKRQDLPQKCAGTA